jgi:hypothetical protein
VRDCNPKQQAQASMGMVNCLATSSCGETGCKRHILGCTSYVHDQSSIVNVLWYWKEGYGNLSFKLLQNKCLAWYSSLVSDKSFGLSVIEITSWAQNRSKMPDSIIKEKVSAMEGYIFI